VNATKNGSRRRSRSRYSALSITVAVLFWALCLPGIDAAQSDISAGLLITPSTSVLLVGETSAFSAVGENGLPVTNAQWSLSTPIADLEVENGEVQVVATHTGRAILTATANNFSASATISVLSGVSLPAATIRWSLLPVPGFETLLVMPAVPNPSSNVRLYSIEWSKTSNAIVRGLTDSGQQLWMTRLSSSASPLTLNNVLPTSGEVFQNQTRISDHSLFILGEKSGFAQNNSSDPSYYKLPLDGKSILLRTCGDFAGGLLLLERGRFRDSLARVGPADGSESWRYHSEGRLIKNWTANTNGDIGIVEILAKPISSALLILDGKTGQVRFRIPFPVSSSTINGFRCTDPQYNILKSIRPSGAGSVFTSSDGNIYTQVETHVESVDIEACKNKQYSFDGETEWKTFQHIHADGSGDFAAQTRIFAGETIPDGFGGVLAAWTYFFPGAKDGEKAHSEARLTRISPTSQQDFTLPVPFWTPGITSFFDENMVLGEGNLLYATTGPFLLRFDTQAGVLSWVRHPPTGSVKLQHATSGGGVLIANAGRLVYFDSNGNGLELPWTVASPNPDDIGLVQTDLFEHAPATPLQLRAIGLTWTGDFVAVEDGAPYGRGALIQLSSR